MRRGRVGLGLVSAVAAMSFGAAAMGQVMWSDGFEDYAPGSDIQGQGGWDAWDGDGTFTSYVSDAFAHTGSNSIEIVGDSDTVYVFPDNDMIIDCGQWTLTAWAYVPSDLVAPNDSYFIVLDRYEHMGADNHWGSQNHYDPDTDTIIADFDLESLPLKYDQWVELRLEVDLETDFQQFYYDGDLLYEDTWTANINSGGSLTIEAIDLFAYAATSVYYDDFELTYNGGCEPPDCLTLEVDQLVGGLTSEFTISDPNGSNAVVALVYGFQEGTTNVNGQFGYCASFGIKGVNQSKLICQKKMTAGVASCSQRIPGNAVGKRVLFQAAMRDTCPDPCMSNLLDLVVQ